MKIGMNTTDRILTLTLFTLLAVNFSSGCKQRKRTTISNSKGIAEGSCEVGELQSRVEERDKAIAERMATEDKLDLVAIELEVDCVAARNRTNCGGEAPTSDSCLERKRIVGLKCNENNDEIKKRNKAREVTRAALTKQIAGINAYVEKEQKEIEFCRDYYIRQRQQELFEEKTQTEMLRCTARKGMWSDLAKHCICNGTPMPDEMPMCEPPPAAPVEPTQPRAGGNQPAQSAPECPIRGWQKDPYGVCRPYGLCTADQFLAVDNKCYPKPKQDPNKKPCVAGLEIKMADGTCKIKTDLDTNGEYLNIDSDHDSVIDGLDRCPGTVLKDIDGDGYYDTPFHFSGEWMGCAQGQHRSY